MPLMAAVTASISRIPGPPRGPSLADDADVVGFDLSGFYGGVAGVLGVEDAGWAGVEDALVAGYFDYAAVGGEVALEDDEASRWLLSGALIG